MYVITKEFSFCASHSLNGLPADHPCSRLHGHNYTVIAELKTDFVDQTGFVVDYRKLDPIKQYLDSKFDHQHLNAVVEFNPTAENLAAHLYYIFKKTFPMLSRITVKAADNITAQYDSN